MRLQVTDQEVGSLIVLLRFLQGDELLEEAMDGDERLALKSILGKLEGTAAHARWAETQVAIDPAKYGFEVAA